MRCAVIVDGHLEPYLGEVRDDTAARRLQARRMKYTINTINKTTTSVPTPMYTANPFFLRFDLSVLVTALLGLVRRCFGAGLVGFAFFDRDLALRVGLGLLRRG